MRKNEFDAFFTSMEHSEYDSNQSLNIVPSILYRWVSEMESGGTDMDLLGRVRNWFLKGVNRVLLAMSEIESLGRLSRPNPTANLVSVQGEVPSCGHQLFVSSRKPRKRPSLR